MGVGVPRVVATAPRSLDPGLMAFDPFGVCHGCRSQAFSSTLAPMGAAVSGGNGQSSAIRRYMKIDKRATKYGMTVSKVSFPVTLSQSTERYGSPMTPPEPPASKYSYWLQDGSGPENLSGFGGCQTGLAGG